MKRLLLNSLILCLWMGMVFFSCSDGNKGKGAAGNGSDTTGKNRPVAGNPVNSRESNTVSSGRDTTLRYKTEIRNNGRDQAKTDSIKDAKTRKKK